MFGMLEYCSLHFNRKIAKSLKKLKSSKFWIFAEMLTSAKVLLNSSVFIKKILQKYVFPQETIIKVHVPNFGGCQGRRTGVGVTTVS